MKRTLTRAAVLLVPMVLVAGCFKQPTKEELWEADTARREQCDEMLKELQNAKDRPLIRLTLQENYNQTCVNNYPDPPG
ncbi:MAG: hypothetical protein AAF358_10610 [Pseudomonadota bacterium]